ncbi:MAG: proton extrusion protein PcxA [Cyanobacteria bacterium J06648_16]
MQSSNLFRSVRQWVTQTPDRALDQAYAAALKITRIEDDYYDGNPVRPGYGSYGESAYSYFRGEVNRELRRIRARMAVFRTGNALLRQEDARELEVQFSDPAAETADGSRATLDLVERPPTLLRKLRFIDEVLGRYEEAETAQSSSQARPIVDRNGSNALVAEDKATLTNPSNKKDKREGLADASSVLPRSILRTVDRVKQDLDPKAEVEVVRNFRSSKGKTKIALRFLLLLVIVPLLTQQLTKNLLVGPIVDYGREATQADVFLNDELEEEALHDLQRFEEKLRFEAFIGKIPPMSEFRIEERVREKAFEIEEEYRQRSAAAIKNVFADIFAALSFGILLTVCKRQVATMKAFMDEIVYGLSDSAKAFIIILFTDIFVGFHSPHGWEILLEGLARHFGLPGNRDFIFLFIATFPVILDTVFKYWIFRYLNRISPSAVATYKNMNE